MSDLTTNLFNMETTTKPVITVANNVQAPLSKVWDYWTKPEHITQWNAASADWHSPRATNDLQVGGKFSYRMEAKDGSMGFDFDGTYDNVRPQEFIAYTLADERKVTISFSADGDITRVVESFEAESMNSLELQQGGWQAILDNFKRYTEGN
jgi:uncharacterized protein YndB with AHSA1/START domain